MTVSSHEALPGERPAHRLPRTSIGQILVTLAVSVMALGVMALILPGLEVDGWGAALLAVTVLGGLNGVLWPIAVRFVSRLIVWTLGLLGLVANGLVLLLTAELVAGLRVDGVGTAVLATLGMTAIGAGPAASSPSTTTLCGVAT